MKLHNINKGNNDNHNKNDINKNRNVTDNLEYL